MELGEPDASGRPRPVPQARAASSRSRLRDHRGHQPGARLQGFDDLHDGQGLDQDRRVRRDHRSKASMPAATISNWAWSRSPLPRAASPPKPSMPVSAASPLEKLPAAADDHERQDQARLVQGGRSATSADTFPSPSASLIPRSSLASPKPRSSRKPSAACPAACAWTARPAGCTAPTVVS